METRTIVKYLIERDIELTHLLKANQYKTNFDLIYLLLNPGWMGEYTAADMYYDFLYSGDSDIDRIMDKLTQGTVTWQ